MKKYFDWLVGDRKHFPKMDLPKVETPMIFKDLGGKPRKSFQHKNKLNSWYNYKNSTKKRGCEAQRKKRRNEIDEVGKRLEDEEKIADAIDTEDLGARADMEWTKKRRAVRILSLMVAIGGKDYRQRLLFPDK